MPSDEHDQTALPLPVAVASPKAAALPKSAAPALPQATAPALPPAATAARVQVVVHSHCAHCVAEHLHSSKALDPLLLSWLQREGIDAVINK